MGTLRWIWEEVRTALGFAVTVLLGGLFLTAIVWDSKFSGVGLALGGLVAAVAVLALAAAGRQERPDLVLRRYDQRWRRDVTQRQVRTLAGAVEAATLEADGFNRLLQRTMRDLARSRLRRRHNISLDDPAQLPQARAALGSDLFHAVTTERQAPLPLPELNRLLDRLERL